MNSSNSVLWFKEFLFIGVCVNHFSNLSSMPLVVVFSGCRDTIALDSFSAGVITQFL